MRAKSKVDREVDRKVDRKVDRNSCTEKWTETVGQDKNVDRNRSTEKWTDISCTEKWTEISRQKNRQKQVDRKVDRDRSTENGQKQVDKKEWPVTKSPNYPLLGYPLLVTCYPDVAAASYCSPALSRQKSGQKQVDRKVDRNSLT